MHRTHRRVLFVIEGDRRRPGAEDVIEVDTDALTGNLVNPGNGRPEAKNVALIDD